MLQKKTRKLALELQGKASWESHYHWASGYVGSSKSHDHILESLEDVVKIVSTVWLNTWTLSWPQGHWSGSHSRGTWGNHTRQSGPPSSYVHGSSGTRICATNLTAKKNKFQGNTCILNTKASQQRIRRNISTNQASASWPHTYTTFPQKEIVFI